MNESRVNGSQAAIMLIASVISIVTCVMVIKAPTTVALLVSGFVAIVLALIFKVKWVDIQKGIIENINSMLVAILILLSVGMLIGSWISSGTVPYMVHLGLNVLSPPLFLVISCLICSVMSIMAGTSWGTISTVGVALMGVSIGLGIPLPYTAGAIVVGAIFGDKLSPLSDTTVMSAAVSGVDIVDHIKQMLWITIPTYLISLVMFFILGMQYSSGSVDGENVSLILETLNKEFTLSPLLLIPPVVVLFLIFKGKPTIPVFGIGILLGCIIAVLVQGDSISEVMEALNSGYAHESGVEIIDTMLIRGGIKSMLGTVALLIAAAVFGAPLKTAGVIDILLEKIKEKCKSKTSILSGTFLLHGLFFLITGSYYVTFAVLGPMFRPLYTQYDLHGSNLSRSLEISGTGFAAIIPWSVTGAFIAETLEVPVFEYLLYTPMIYLSIILSFIYFITGFGIRKLTEKERLIIESEEV